MNIDKRLDRLTERHEALTVHVEILTANLAQLKERIDDLTTNVDKQRRTMDDLMVGFSTLAELARGHEHRIVRLEAR
jgi:prefoldin subunit 5